jgi:hypothetical protein
MMKDAALVLDAAVVVAIGVAICLFGDQPAVMGSLVALAFAGRMAAWAALDLGPMGREAGFLLICTVVGAFNDWNTVDGHGVYAYALPAEAPHISSIPLWMLAYWGLILRFVATLGASERLGPLSGRRPPWRLGVMLLLVVLTRQGIYRFSLDPWLSWLPFAAAALVWIVVLRPDAHDRRLGALALAVGTGAEVALIQIGGLHHYELGIVGGVPLWIILWWPMATLVWKEVAYALTSMPGSPLSVRPITSAVSTPAPLRPATSSSA